MKKIKISKLGLETHHWISHTSPSGQAFKLKTVVAVIEDGSGSVMHLSIDQQDPEAVRSAKDIGNMYHFFLSFMHVHYALLCSSAQKLDEEKV